MLYVGWFCGHGVRWLFWTDVSDLQSIRGALRERGGTDSYRDRSADAAGLDGIIPSAC